MRPSLLRALGVAFATLSVAALLGGCAGQPELSATDTTPAITESLSPETAVQTESVRTINPNIQTVLIMGLDKFEFEPVEFAYTNKMQSDFNLLLVIDGEAKTVRCLNINRDTMTEIPRLGLGGANVGTFVGQLALAHTYGSGGSDSCLNATKAVSDLLNVPVDHYIALTMDAVPILNDAIGGVEVTIQDDLTSIDPAWTEGTTVLLDGEQALAYVRARMTVGDGLNTSCLRRQETYLNGFYEKTMAMLQKDDNFLAKTMLKISGDMQSDLSANRLEQLADLLGQCKMHPVQTLPGETKMGEEYYEFYPDQGELAKIVEEIFYVS